MKKSNTKRSLIASVTSLVLCCALLIGTTFAWFTDSVSTGKNTIASGNLDVELEYTTDFAEWKTVGGETALVDPDALWEPGHTEVVYLRVLNAGSLALKYQFSMNIVNETEGTNVAGNTFKLSDYLEYGIVEDQTAAFGSRDAARAAVTDAKSLSAYTAEGHLTAGSDPQYMALVIYMPETVGNEANHKTGTAAPTIDLGLNLVATQDTVESDSFDNQYDANASYPITDSSALNDAIAAGGNITLGTDATTTDSMDISNDTKIDLGGNTLTIGNNTELTNGADLSISGGTILRETYSGYVDVRPGTTTDGVISYTNVVFDNTYKTVTYGPCTDRVASALEFCPENGGNATFYFKNCTFNNSKVLFEGLSGTTGSFTATFENCTFNNLGTSAGIEVANYLEGTITVKDCTFNLTATATMNAVSSENSVVTWNFEGVNTVNGYAATASGEAGTVDQIKVMTPSVKVYSIRNNGTVVNGLNTVNVTGIAAKN